MIELPGELIVIISTKTRQLCTIIYIPVGSLTVLRDVGQHVMRYVLLNSFSDDDEILHELLACMKIIACSNQDRCSNYLST